jgi:chaperonin cofactor prefoldin
MEFQSLFNILIGAGLTVIGWFARELWDATQKLKQDVSDLELNVSEHYVKKVDINARFDKIESILEKLFDKLDSKADKKI